jgi:hypothetical protein
MNADKRKVPSQSEHHGETGARKFPPRPGRPDEQDGISRGGTVTGDPGDAPPEGGYGLTESPEDDSLSTGKSDGRDMARKPGEDC